MEPRYEFRQSKGIELASLALMTQAVWIPFLLWKFWWIVQALSTVQIGQEKTHSLVFVRLSIMSLFLSSSFEVSFLSLFSHFSLFSFLSYLFSFLSFLCFYFPSLLFPSLSLNPCLLYKISFMVHGIACTFLMFRRRKNVFVSSLGYCHLYIDLFVCRDSYAWWIKSLVER